MDFLCEFCGVERAFVYCNSDSARLCLNCDACVHSANSLSSRHPRSLICDKCYSQPAIVRCMFDKMSLCQTCDNSNQNVCAALGHRRVVLDSYNGCPSLTEMSCIWPFPLDPTFSSASSNGGGLGNGWESLCALPKSGTKCLEQVDNNKTEIEIESCDVNKYESWMPQSSVLQPNPNFIPYSIDHPDFLPQDSNLQPKGCSSSKDTVGILDDEDDDGLCDSLNVDNVQLNFEGGNNGIFDCSQGTTSYQIEDAGLDCLLMERNTSSVSESNGLIQSAVEALPSVQQDCVGFQSSRASVMMQAMNSNANCVLINPACNRNMNMGFPQGQVHSSIPLSLPNINGESSINTTDFQECGLSPALLSVDTPWESNLESTCPQARDKAIVRYNEKKKNRKFGKQIRYASRKARADTRKRVKGRFVKAGEAYDYDPLVTGSY